VGDATRRRGGQDGATSITPPREAPQASRVTSTDPNRGRNAWVIVAAVVLVIAAGVGIAFALTSKPNVVTTTTAPTTTTTVAPTTTTLPSTSHSLAKLVNDVVAGQSAHAIGPQVAQSISSGAQQAVTDFTAGNLQAAASDLQGVATTIANGLASGYINPTYAALMQSDLKTLANTLGLSAAATPSSSTTTTSAATTTTTTQPFGPGNGNGNGPL
jgi:hypothetical protein